MDQATEFEAKTEDVSEHLSKAGQAAADVARQKMNDMREGASQLYEQGRAKAQEFQENANSFIKEQPLKAVMIAAGVGLLTGLLLARAK